MPHLHRRRIVRVATWSTGVGAASTLTFGSFLFAEAADLDPISLIRVGVLFLISLAWTSCVGAAALLAKATGVLVNTMAAGMLLKQAVEDQHERAPLRVVDSARRG